MEAEIRPEPTDDEREALIAALEQIQAALPPPPGAAWRRAALEQED